MRSDLFLTAGSSTGFIVGSNTYNDASLKGWSFDIERRGYGTLEPTVDYIILSNGGFQLLSGTFQVNEIDILHFSDFIAPASTSNYTNGIDISVVLPELRNRIGWRQPTKAASPVLNSYNLLTKSGRYFDGFHSLVTINNIKAVQEDDKISDSDFNQFLSNLQDDSILRTISEVFRSPVIIEQKLLYTRWGTNDLPIVNSGMFCGFMINIANTFGVTTQINNCTLYFNGSCDFNLYVFQDGVKNPLRTIPVHVDAYVRNEIRIDNLYLNYKTGRRYFLGYFQDDLGGVQAIQEQVDQWATMLMFEARPFAAPRIGSQYDFNHDYKQYTALPRGLNLEIITFYDHTQQILRKANLFDEAIGLSVAAMVLELINMSVRSNTGERKEKMVSGNLFQELNQAFATDTIPVSPGIKSRLIAEYKKIHEAFFPKIKADSVNRNGNKNGLDSYEENWIKNNIEFVNNPPFMKT